MSGRFVEERGPHETSTCWGGGHGDDRGHAGRRDGAGPRVEAPHRHASGDDAPGRCRPRGFPDDSWGQCGTESARWLAGIFDGPKGGEKIAVSTTGDPTGSWFVYTVTYPRQPGGGCPDQGKGAVDSDIFALGFNEFSGAGCT